jgi:hypothetical protein
VRVLLLEDGEVIQGMWRVVLNIHKATAVSAYCVGRAEEEFRHDPSGFVTVSF